MYIKFHYENLIENACYFYKFNLQTKMTSKRKLKYVYSTFIAYTWLAI